MRFVGSVLVVLVAIGSQAAIADAYVYYQVSNSALTPVTFEHYEGPGVACESSVGNLWVPPLTATAAEFFSGTNLCVALLSDGNLNVGTVAAVAGSCAGGERFDFRLSICGDYVNEEQRYALSLATFLWLCLIGGLLVGFKVAE